MSVPSFTCHLCNMHPRFKPWRQSIYIFPANMAVELWKLTIQSECKILPSWKEEVLLAYYLRSSGMWRRVTASLVPDFSRQHSGFIFNDWNDHKERTWYKSKKVSGCFFDNIRKMQLIKWRINGNRNILFQVYIPNNKLRWTFLFMTNQTKQLEECGWMLS